ncbi:hypothetical protein POSPLADRAFT_1050769 [Postia placenta MAD-698-R-SB12]|uniref:AB hydrolase-1 domain-containing protein n=1 Tax=Postia placenta MAD-698-R-SB12 TaxID=670580 RepID=A0A1X6MJ25_9APHY|nr:hypothetical protein POSPLADRAFT_1050769 [Postia placenta MAD-698-R-SB12]OSX56246.1 hypothetical protein POSPLADRAFT_1050769 [Postia placenta MAD-698-R-SB12]
MSSDTVPVNTPADAQSIPTIFDPTTCTRKGLCPVTILRNEADDPLQSHSLYYEQHGTGPEKILFIMGLNGSSFSWLPQVDYFGRKPEYSVLVFDNRGVGNSDAPRGPYSTSAMADDVVALLDYVGWTSERDMHVVGVSLGGMIALGNKANSMDSATTCESPSLSRSRIYRTKASQLKGSTSLISWRLLTMTDPETKIPVILDMVFPQSWLNAPASGDPEGRTNREVQTVEYRKRIELTRPQKPVGAISQMIAGLTHSVSPERLRTIAASIPKVLIVTGDQDNLINPSNSLYMKEHMPEAELVQWKNTGHGFQVQYRDRFHELLEH